MFKAIFWIISSVCLLDAANADPITNREENGSTSGDITKHQDQLPKLKGENFIKYKSQNNIVGKKEQLYSVHDLFKAISRRDIDKVNRIIRFGIDVNEIDEDGMTALRLAVSHDFPEAVDALLRAGANPMTGLRMFSLPLLKIALRDKVDHRILLSLMQYDELPEGEKECEQIAEALYEKRAIREGEEIFLQKIIENTPSYIKAKTAEKAFDDGIGNEDVEGMIVAKNLSYDYDEIFKILKQGLLTLIKYENRKRKKIETSNADIDELIDAILRKKYDILREKIENGTDVNFKENFGGTAIEYAIKNGDPEAVKALIFAGAELSQKDLITAASNGHLEIIKILVAVMPKVIVNEKQLRDAEKTALRQQIKGCEECTGFLREYCLLPSKEQLRQNKLTAQKNDKIKKIRNLISTRDDPAAINLIQAPFNGDKKWLKGKSDLISLAIRQGCDKSVIEALLDAGISIDTKSDGNSILHLAAMYGQAETLGALLKHLRSDGSDKMKIFLNQLNSDGETALHLALKSGNKETVEMLLNCSEADVRVKGEKAVSVMYYAVLKNNIECVRRFIELGLPVWDVHVDLAIENRDFDILSLLLKNFVLQPEKLQNIFDVLSEMQDDIESRVFANRTLKLIKKIAKNRKIDLKKKIKPFWRDNPNSLSKKIGSKIFDLILKKVRGNTTSTSYGISYDEDSD